MHLYMYVWYIMNLFIYLLVYHDHNFKIIHNYILIAAVRHIFHLHLRGRWIVLFFILHELN